MDGNGGGASVPAKAPTPLPALAARFPTEGAVVTPRAAAAAAAQVVVCRDAAAPHGPSVLDTSCPARAVSSARRISPPHTLYTPPCLVPGCRVGVRSGPGSYPPPPAAAFSHAHAWAARLLARGGARAREAAAPSQRVLRQSGRRGGGERIERPEAGGWVGPAPRS